MNEEYQKSIELFPPQLAELLQHLPVDEQEKIQEVRVRRRRPMSVFDGKSNRFVLPDGNLTFQYSKNLFVIEDELFEECYLRFCGYSVHSHQSELLEGYLTAKTGDRIGVAVSTVRTGVREFAVRGISGLNFRISREIPGVFSSIARRIPLTKGTIFAGPPSSGKTTLLRDAARTLSDEYLQKVVVIDERYEISAAEDGIVRRQIGFLTDTVCGLDKARAIELATRTLSPQLILCDEIGNEEEVERIHAAFANGIAFIVSVHCGDAEDLFQNRIIQKLMACHAFQTLVLLVGAARPGTVERIISREEYYAQSGGNPFR